MTEAEDSPPPGEPRAGSVWFSAVLAALFGLAVTVAAFYPGYMSPDSISQLAQGRRGMYSDWHPPVMAWVWGMVDRVVAGAAGMLLLHNVLFWGALAVVACLRFRRRWLAVAAILAIGFFPPVFALLGTIWKDVGLAVSLLVAFALLLVADLRRSNVALAAAPAALLYAISVRHNGAAAVLPFAVWTGALIVREVGSRRRLATLLASVLTFVSLLAGGMILDSILTDQRSYKVQAHLLHDLAAISIETGVNQLPLFAQQGQPLTTEELRRIYSTETVAVLLCCDNSTRRVTQLTDGNEVQRLQKYWLTAVRQHPWIYLKHRWANAVELFALRRPTVCRPYHHGIDDNSLGLIFRPRETNRVAMETLDRYKDTLLFRGWVYLVAAVVGSLAAIVLWRRIRQAPFLVLVSSAALYMLPYFFVSSSCDFRTLWWGVLAVLVSPVVLGVQSRRGEVASGEPSTLVASQPSLVGRALDSPLLHAARARSASFFAVLAALCGFAVTVATFYPGYMSPDSITQLEQARRGVYSDWHPPLMAWLWGLFDRIVGPGAMLLLHSLLFWGSLAALAWQRFPKRWAAGIVILAIGFFPPIFALLGTIWKDVSLAATLLTAFVVLLRAHRRPSWVPLGFVAVLLLYAVAVRHNAVTAVVPFAVWAASIAIRLTRLRAARAWIATSLAAVVLLACLLATRAIIEAALTSMKLYTVQALFVHDLTAISIATGRNQLPLFVQQDNPLTIPELQRIYTPDTIVHLLCCDTTMRRLNAIADGKQVAVLRAAWLEALTAHPGPYLRHRWDIARQSLGWRRPTVCLPYYSGIVENSLGLVFHSNALNRFVMDRMANVRDSLLFRGWLYLSLSLVGLAWALAMWRWRPNVPFLVLTSSAVLYFLPYFFVATACDFRLLWWGVVAVLVSPLVLGLQDDQRPASGSVGVPEMKVEAAEA